MPISTGNMPKGLADAQNYAFRPPTPFAHGDAGKAAFGASPVSAPVAAALAGRPQAPAMAALQSPVSAEASLAKTVAAGGAPAVALKNSVKIPG